MGQVPAEAGDQRSVLLCSLVPTHPLQPSRSTPSVARSCLPPPQPALLHTLHRLPPRPLRLASSTKRRSVSLRAAGSSGRESAEKAAATSAGGARSGMSTIVLESGNRRTSSTS